MHRRRAGDRGRPRESGSRGRPLNWSERILDFPVRSAAVDDFLKELKAHGSADLNAVMATLNDGELCRETLQHWIESGWVRVAAHSPLTALQGPLFSEELTLSEFCGRGKAEVEPGVEQEASTEEADSAPPQEDEEPNEHS